MYDERQGWLFINPDAPKPAKGNVKIGEFLEILTREFEKGISRKTGWGYKEVLAEYHQAIIRALHIEFEIDSEADPAEKPK